MTAAVPRAAAEVARFLGGRCHNFPARDSLDLTGLCLPHCAGRGDLEVHVPGLRVTSARLGGADRVCLTTPAGAAAVGEWPSIVVDNLNLASARACAWLLPRRDNLGRAYVAPGAYVAASAVLGQGVRIEAGSVIGAGAVVADGARVGAFSHIGPSVVIGAHAVIGNRVMVGAAAVLGDDGFAFMREGERWVRLPSLGRVVIEDDVNIMAHAVVHAGALSDTVIGRGCVLDSHVLIGHDAHVGADTAIAGLTAVAGAARIGRACRIGGMVGIGEGVRVADRVTVNAMSMVARSVDTAGATIASGWPAIPVRAWWRQVLALRRMAVRHDKEDEQSG